MKNSFKYSFITTFLFIFSRLPNLGYDIFNTDVWKWKARSFDFSSGVFYLDFAKTIQKYHPGVILMWIGTAGIKIYNAFYEYVLNRTPLDNDINTIFELHAIQKTLLVVVIGITLGFTFHALRNLFGTRYAVISIALISIEPFYVALTRVFHLEGLMSTFMIASFIWLYYFIQEKTDGTKLLLSGVFASLAILTKTSSLFLVPFAGLVLFVTYLRVTKKVVHSIKLSLVYFSMWLITVVLLFVGLWPAMWVAPLEALQVLYRGIFTIGIERGHQQVFFGELVTDPGPAFYPVVLWLRSSLYLVIGLIGSLALFVKGKRREANEFVVFLLLFAFLYAIEISIPSKKLDRYILPSMLALIMIASFFFEYLIMRLRKLSFALFLLLLAPGIYLNYYLHPDYFAYYSPLAGGLSNGIKVIDPKWSLGQHSMKQYFAQKIESGEYIPFVEGESFANSQNLTNKLTVAFPEKYYTQYWPFLRQIGGWAVIKDLTPEAIKTTYFVYPVWADDSSQEDRFNLIYVDSIEHNGVPLYNVYRRIQ